MKSTKVRSVNVHHITLEELDDLDDEDFSEDGKDKEDIEWDNADEELQGGARIHSPRVLREISLRIALEGSEAQESTRRGG